MSDVRILQGDCLDVLPTLAEGSVDAVVTDPPYGTDAISDGYGRRQNYGGTIGRIIAGDTDQSTLEETLAGLPHVLKADSWAAIFCSPRRHKETASICEANGFPVSDEVIWDKSQPGLGRNVRYQHEIVLICRHGNPTAQGTIISVIRAHLSHQERHKRHPHEKPVEVVRKLVQYVSRPGDLILDPFTGSGTTAVACLKTGRRFVGVEIDPRYVAIAERRLADAATPLLDALEAT